MGYNHKGFASFLIVGAIVLFLISGSAYYLIKNNQQNKLNRQDGVPDAQNNFTTCNPILRNNDEHGNNTIVLSENGRELTVDTCSNDNLDDFNRCVFKNLSCSPLNDYFIYSVSGYGRGNDTILYNIKTGEKKSLGSVNTVKFTDDEKHLIVCADSFISGEIYGKIFSFPLLSETYSVPREDGWGIEGCEYDSFTKIVSFKLVYEFRSQENNPNPYYIYYNLETGKTEQSDSKNQIEEINNYFYNSNEAVKYFCVSPKNNYLLACSKKDSCIKINNIDDEKISALLSSDLSISFTSERDYEKCSERLSSGDEYAYKYCFEAKYFSKDNADFYYVGYRDAGMSKLYVDGQVYNPQTGLVLRGYEMLSGYCDGSEEDIKQCNEGITAAYANAKKDYSEKFIKLSENLELTNNFDCGN